MVFELTKHVATLSNGARSVNSLLFYVFSRSWPRPPAGFSGAEPTTRQMECRTGQLGCRRSGGQMHVASQAPPTAKETSGSRSSTGQHVFVITGRIDSVTRFVGVLIPHALWRLSGRRVVPGIHVAENYFHHPISNPQILTAQGQDRFTAKTKGRSRREL